MGLWQNLVVSYDKNAEALKKSYPLSTTSISNKGDKIVVIVIDGNGEFIRSDVIEKENQKKGIDTEFITIPASEESLRRSSTAIVPYPVFEEYGYLKGMVGESKQYIEKFCGHCDHVTEYVQNLKLQKHSEKCLTKWVNYKKIIYKQMAFGKKNDVYIKQLKGFSESDFTTAQIKAIYQYATKRTVASDLEGVKLKDKTNIIFKVEIEGCQQTKVWENEAFFDAWHQYYLCKKKEHAEKRKLAKEKLANQRVLSRVEKKKLKEFAGLKDVKLLDYITGICQPIATSHPKKISNASANSKLISGNDTTNYTFRGKFTDSSEAVSIGYESSQKAHQFLRYLINDRGYYCGEQVILSFTIDSKEKLLPLPIEDKSIWAVLQESEIATESDVQINLRAGTGFDYAEALKKSLAGYGFKKTLKQHAKTAVIALDAATTGRLSITFYRELNRNEYLEKIANWHDGCKWNLQFWDKKKEKYVPYIGAPSVDRIIEAVYGKPRSGKDKSYIKIKKGARERLIRCIFDGAFLPSDYVVAAIRRVSNPLGTTRNGKFDRNEFERILVTTCALVRKDFQQRNREGYKLSIELDRTDRDYLYGRLLGAADKLEEYALYKKDSNRVVTAAIRHMQTFAQRPFRTWQTIHSCLNPYIQTVKGGFAFQEIETIKNKFVSVADYEKDEPLNGSYLIGYYHERAYIDCLVKNIGKNGKPTDNNNQEGNNDGK